MRFEKARVQEILDKAIKVSEADETEVIFGATESSLTRFSENRIHQNVMELNAGIITRAAAGKRVGVASTNVVDGDGIKNVVHQALEIARAQGEKEDYYGLPEPKSVADVNVFDRKTAEYDPRARAAAAGKVISAAKSAGMKAAGSFKTSENVLGVANSKGVTTFHPYTSVELVTVIDSGVSSGYGEASAWKVDDVNVGGIAEDAVKRAELSKDPRDIEPGKYDVVLEHYCLSDIMKWMAFVVFDTKNVLEGRSLLSKRMGEKIMGDNITITDDGLNPAGISIPFDYEGIPKEKVELVKNGVAAGLLYDTATSHEAKKPNNGHALPPGYTGGPIPLDIFIEPGDTDVETMISSMEKGLYITRFHYINGFVEPMQAVFTGMTRDGTFWVEDGKIAYPVKNLRWTQSMLAAFSNVVMISKERKLFGSADEIKIYTPAMYIKEFEFTGTTEH
jgi:PmbA protein